MFSTLIRRAPSIQRTFRQETPYDVYTSPYKAQRLWPPDFEKISRKHQFRLERKYKRRSKLKWARPRWTKFVKTAQMATILFVGVYGVLFLDWSKQGNPDHKPFNGIRTWFFGLGDSIWTKDQVRKSNDSDASPVAKAGN